MRITGPGPSLFARSTTIGEVPLPPYIEAARRRRRGGDVDDRERYQTVYAAQRRARSRRRRRGCTSRRRCWRRCAARGHEIAPVTLHVGPGHVPPGRGRRPARAPHARRALRDPDATAAAGSRAPGAEGRPVVAVGTTVVRTLEAAARATGRGARRATGATDLFIAARATSSGWSTDLITNFHLPRSTLLMLVAAFAGRERVLAAYARRGRARLPLLQLRRRDADHRRGGGVSGPAPLRGRARAPGRRARAACCTPPHGPIETPVFMPVGTQATVKALSPGDLERARRRASSSATPITCRCGRARS